jgi:chromosome segregation ATPase
MTDNRWLEYRAEVMQDQLLELDARAVEDASAVKKVRTALLERDEALRRAHEDLARARTLAAEWETEVVATRAQPQQDRGTLDRARAWRSQAEEKAKKVEELRTSLADKVASLASTEGSFSGSGSRASGLRRSSSRSRLPLLRLGPPLSASTWREKRPRAYSSRSAPHSRGCRQPSSNRTKKSRGSTGS